MNCWAPTAIAFSSAIATIAAPVLATAAAPRDPSPIGIISEHFGDPAYRQLAADAGFKWLRLWIQWDELEPAGSGQPWPGDSPVVQDALAKYDNAVDGAIDSGFSILGIIHGTPLWAAGPDDGTCPQPAAESKPPTAPQHFENFTRRLAERYGDRIAAWELWNEPDFCTYWSGTEKQYRDSILAPGYDGIKTAQPDAIVIAPALGKVKTSSDLTPWLTENGLLVRPIDALSVHSFAQWTDAKNTMNVAHQFEACTAVGDCVSKYWMTAFGFAESDLEQGVCPKASVNDAGNRILDALSKCENQADCERTFYFIDSDIWFVEQGLGPPVTCDVALADLNLAPRPKYFQIQEYTGVIPSQCFGQPNGTSCSDGNACNGMETCQTGVCTDGIALVCDDGDPCTVDECLAGSGCDATKDLGLPECVPTWLPAVLSILDDGCGDGVVDSGEQCDDGNTTAGGCCSPTCQFEASGGLCDDGNPCTTGDTCQAGACSGVAAPEPDCRAARRGSVQLMNRSPDTADKFSWKWLLGPTTSAEFGNPATGLTGYELCVYDTTGGIPSVAWHASIPGGGFCSGRPCWQAAAGSYRFVDTAGATDGITKVILKAGIADNAKIQVKGSGAALGLPALPLAQDPAVTVQLKSTDGECWTIPYEGPAARSDAERFKDAYTAPP
jgi:cysteine-rich repeat protein